MSELRLMISIVRRDQGEAYLEFYREHQILTVFASLCNGTASKSMLDYLGVEKTEKVMLQSVVAAGGVRRLMRRLVERLGIDMPGNGIAISIPVSSVGGARSMNYLTAGQELTTDEVKKVSEIPYALIIAITEKGTTDMIMDAARSAGARGGTVINAKGTGADFTARFFGVSIAAEKELVYIVAKKREKGAIMQAIMDQAGMDSDAHAVVFSLPVDNIVGLRSVMEEDSAEA